MNASITAYPMGFELACPTGMYLVNLCCPLPNLPALGMRAGISFERCDLYNTLSCYIYTCIYMYMYNVCVLTGLKR